ncbi:MAG: hypothetical protein KJ971_01700 [Firmicutes bacterium]|nr:hypothetical protein [Bacillota bacterium]
MGKFLQNLRWYRLDNAAKIYPVLTTERYTHVFRVAATLKNDINPEILKQAILDCKNRFPTFFVRMKHGIFWYYFEPNPMDPIIKEENSIVCEKINTHKNNHYFFTFFYYRERISLEVFHALCDGGAAIIFLKAVIFQYLGLLGHDLDNSEDIFTIGEIPSYKEAEDSYEVNFTETKTIKNKVPDAYLIKAKRFPYPGCGIIDSKIETDELLKLAKAKKVSLSQYISAVLIYATILTGDLNKLQKMPINICIPINLRPLYHSETLKNFSLYIHSIYYMKDNPPDFDDILLKVKSDFMREMDPIKIQSKINSNVKIVKNFLVRICPLPLKKILFKIGYSVYGKKPTTITFTNFGEIKVPNSMIPFIDSFTFNLGSGSKPAVAINSFQGYSSIIFSRAIINTELERTFFAFLSQQGIKILIKTNRWESYLNPSISFNK